MLAEERLEICRNCPLYKESIDGPICNPRKWINPETGRTSYYPKEGYKRGCACLLDKKVHNPNNHCVANK